MKKYFSFIGYASNNTSPSGRYRITKFLLCAALSILLGAGTLLAQPNTTQPFDYYSLINGSDTTLNYWTVMQQAQTFFADTNVTPRMRRRFERWRYYWANHVNSDGDIHAFTNHYRNYINSTSANNAAPSICNDGGDWTAINNHVGGFISNGMMQSVYVESPSVIYAGSSGGGLWKTINGGDDWFCISDNTRIPITGVNTIVKVGNDLYVPSNKNTFGQGVNVGILKFERVSDFVYNISETGMTWDGIYKDGIVKILPDPTDPNKNHFYVLASTYIYETNDRFQTYTDITDNVVSGTNLSINRSVFTDIEYRINADGSVNTNDLIVATKGYADGYSRNSNLFRGTRTSGGSFTWNTLLPDLGTFSQTNSHKRTNIAIATAINRPNEVLMTYTEDGANYFRKFNTTTASFSAFPSNSISNVYTSSNLEIDPDNPNVIYTVCATASYNDGFNRSIDGGNSFINLSTKGSYYADPRTISIWNTSGGTWEDNEVFMVNDGGVYRLGKDNNGPEILGDISGSNITNALQTAQLYESSISENGDGRLIFGAQDAGAYIYSPSITINNGWNNNVVGDGGSNFIDYANPTYAYLTQNGSCRKYNITTGGFIGGSGQASNVTQFLAGTFVVHQPLIQDSKNPNIVYWARSTGDAVSTKSTVVAKIDLSQGTAGAVTDIIFGLNAGGGFRDLNDIQGFAVANSDPKVMYLSLQYGQGIQDPYPCNTNPKFFKTVDGGANWESLCFDLLRYLHINCITVDPLNANRLWIGMSGFDNVPNTNNRLFYSEDGGHSWISIGEGLPPFPITSLVYQQGSNDILYAGTEVGVYRYDKSISQWVCFNNHLPTVMVTDLKINYCEQKLYASTFGRVLWESPLYNNPNEHITSSNLIMDGRNFLTNDLRVKTGKTLTLKGYLYMAKDKHIIVETGAKLIVDGGTITNLCGDMWGGIRLLGQANMAQIPTNQGMAILQNNAVIEYAWNGISTWDGQDVATTGGMINAENTTFRNNWRDVELMRYTLESPAGYIAQFTNCNFDIDDNYIAYNQVNPSGAILHPRISNWACKGVRLTGCKFNNNVSSTAAFSVPVTEQSAGVLTLDGTFSISSNAQEAEFNNLPYGVWASGANTLKQGVHSLRIADVHFSNCNRGTFLEGYVFPYVGTNRFDIPAVPFFVTPDAPRPYGSYLENCYVYQVNDNAYTGFGNDPYNDDNYGAVFHNMHGANEVTARNKFSKLTFASQAIGQNKDATSTNGLVYKCNDFEENAIDVHAVLNSQGNEPVTGIARSQGTSGKSAGNLFGNDSNYLLRNLENTNADGYTYFHHDPSNNYRVEPSSRSNNITLVNTGANDITGDCALGNEGGGSGTPAEVILEKRAMVNLYRLTLNTMKDGGNTESLKLAVETATNADAWQKYMDLMNQAGYLSDEVLQKVAAKEFAFSNAMIRDILVANPQAAKSWAVQENLDERFNPLPLFMRTQIDEGLEAMSPLEYIEQNLTTTRREHDATLNTYLEAYLSDEIDHSAEAIELIASNYSLEYDYLKAQLYDDRGEYAQAEALLNTLPTVYNLAPLNLESHNRYTSFRNLRLTWQAQNKNMAYLDAASINSLQELAQFTDATGRAANNILVFNGVSHSNEPLYGTEGTPKKARRYGTEDTQQVPNLVLYPNPSKDIVNIKYNTLTEGAVVLKIVNTQGAVVYQSNLKNTSDEISLQLGGLPNGLYQCILICGSANCGHALLNIQH